MFVNGRVCNKMTPIMGGTTDTAATTLRYLVVYPATQEKKNEARKLIMPVGMVRSEVMRDV